MGGGHPSSVHGGCCITLFNTRCTMKWAWDPPPHLHRWAREMKHPEPHLVSGPDKIHAWMSETRQPAGRWVGGTAGPESGQGIAEGVAGLPGQVGPAWQGGWGRRQGGVFWVWGKASALPGAVVSTDPGCCEEARQSPGGPAAGPDNPGRPLRPGDLRQTCPRGLARWPREPPGR